MSSLLTQANAQVQARLGFTICGVGLEPMLAASNTSIHDGSKHIAVSSTLPTIVRGTAIKAIVAEDPRRGDQSPEPSRMLAGRTTC